MQSSRSTRVQIIEPEMLLAAYRAGFFPMADSRTGSIRWYSPDPRAVIPLDTFTIPRSLRLVVKKGIYQMRINSSFEEVIRNCGARKETWISEEIIQSYVNLHRLGFAHSVEAWSEGKLEGGLYGVALGGAFFGESMFSRARDASKVALVYLVERLKAREFELLDTQYSTAHLDRFGTVEISREEYLGRLRRAIEKQTSFVD